MMKTVITFLTIFLLAIANTQTLQAQTKEETIAWIKEKIEKYRVNNSYIRNLQVSPCNISWEEYEVSNLDTYSLYTFNPSTEKDWKIDERGIRANTDVVTQRVYDDNSRKYLTSYTTSSIFLKNGEADIYGRMIKALNHLATFCEQGKNEAF